MPNPYSALGKEQFWKTAVATRPEEEIHPRAARRFALRRTDRLATAGSCFAQNVAKYLRAADAVEVMESEPLSPEDPVFSGRYGNIYTARQLLQLFEEVQAGTPDPDCAAMRRSDGRYVDLFRPYMAPRGFESADAVRAARARHLQAIAPVFARSDVFVFTLGLTEGWENPETGRVYPICPGVYAEDTPAYRFHNFTYEDVLEDMQRFVTALTALNPGIRILLTVSPVPLTASYGEDDVLSATMLSKSILRAVCGALTARHDNAFYFPSYEMIANPFTAQSAYADNLREVRPEAISRVMARFEADYIGKVSEDVQDDADDILCDDVEIEASVGF